MYLARTQIKGRFRYFIRESYSEADIILSRNVFDLGEDPETYVIYPGGNAYYIDEQVEDALCEQGVRIRGNELDDLFWPFVRPDIRKAQSYFRQREHRYQKPSDEDLMPGSRFHLFDRRRTHYLKYGQMDQEKIGRVSPRLFQNLRGKSRDEIEQYFLNEERILRPREIKSYVYVIFDLQKHFTQSFAKTMPQGLNQDQVDEAFIKEICRMHGDRKFWAGMEAEDRLNEYLVRYLVMFFDHDYGHSPFLEDILDDWINRHRRYRPPTSRKPVSVSEAGTIFGLSEEEMRKMTRRELSRLFRKKARELHPDQGGDHEAFIRLTEAYQEMRYRKK